MGVNVGEGDVIVFSGMDYRQERDGVEATWIRYLSVQFEFLKYTLFNLWLISTFLPKILS